MSCEVGNYGFESRIFKQSSHEEPRVGANAVGLRDTNYRSEDIRQGRRSNAANQMPPPVLLPLLDNLPLSPHKFPKYPLAPKKVIQEEIKNGFAPLVSWTVSLIATLTLAEAAFSFTLL